MEIETFRIFVKNAKMSAKMVHLNQVKVVHYTNSNPDEWIITQKPEQECCSKCHQKISNSSGVVVKFEKEQGHLTIFEAGLLFMLFARNELPCDYARWDRCVAGQKFIENIKSIEVLN